MRGTRERHRNKDKDRGGPRGGQTSPAAAGTRLLRKGDRPRPRGPPEVARNKRDRRRDRGARLTRKRHGGSVKGEEEKKRNYNMAVWHIGLERNNNIRAYVHART